MPWRRSGQPIGQPAKGRPITCSYLNHNCGIWYKSYAFPPSVCSSPSLLVLSTHDFTYTGLFSILLHITTSVRPRFLVPTHHSFYYKSSIAGQNGVPTYRSFSAASLGAHDRGSGLHRIWLYRRARECLRRQGPRTRTISRRNTEVHAECPSRLIYPLYKGFKATPDHLLDSPNTYFKRPWLLRLYELISASGERMGSSRGSQRKSRRSGSLPLRRLAPGDHTLPRLRRAGWAAHRHDFRPVQAGSRRLYQGTEASDQDRHERGYAEVDLDGACERLDS